MKNKFMNILIATLLVIGVMITASPVSAHDNHEDMPRLTGVIAAVDTTASTLTITPKDGSPNVVLNVDSTTFIKRNGHSATLADLQVGDLVEARYNPTTMLASRIVAKVKLVRLTGFVAAVDTTAGTLTIMPKNGGPNVVLNVDAKTYIRRNEHSATLADLQVGDKVEAFYSPISMLAYRIMAKLNVVRVEGIIAAVDTTASTLTVTPKKGGPNLVLNVNTATSIKRNGQTATLTDLQVGDMVQARYNPITMLAYSIVAKVKLVWLEGVIAAVDTTASTLTITPKHGGANVVLNVDAKTSIKRNGQAASLADLKVGDLVQARYNPTSMLAVSIAAKIKLVWLEGFIAAIDTTASTLTITPKDGGANVVLNVNSATSIKRNEHSATLADLQVGDKVEARYDPVAMLAYAIMAKLNVVRVEGVIAAVDTTASTLTVTPKDGGANVVLNVDAKTSIKRNGQTAILADLQAGDQVKALYNPITFLAARVEATNQVRLEGVIAAVDTTASTLTITPEHNAVNVILHVDSTTVIKINDHSATLADLQVGDRVDALYDSTSMLALRISASRHHHS
jgi:Cu/Ag efflux protein CusF